MEKKNKSTSNIRIILELLLLILVATAVCIWLYGKQYGIEKINLTETVLDSGSIQYHIDKYLVEQESVTISGWCIDVTKSSEYFDTYVSLKNEMTGECYKISTAFIKRKDVTNAFGKEIYNYDNSGFVARIVNTGRLQTGKYKICLLYNRHSDNILIDTGIVIDL